MWTHDFRVVDVRLNVGIQATEAVGFGFRSEAPERGARGIDPADFTKLTIFGPFLFATDDPPERVKDAVDPPHQTRITEVFPCSFDHLRGRGRGFGFRGTGSGLNP